MEYLAVTLNIAHGIIHYNNTADGILRYNNIA